MASAQSSSAAIVVPGDKIGSEATHQVGAGAYAREGAIFASRVGTRVETAASGAKVILSVARPGGDEPIVPAVGSVVLARVTRIAQLAVTCEIVVVDERTLPQPASAVVRRENVRDGEIDKIVMIDCFRPGDIIRAVVASLGDARAYFLSTANPAHGVVHATSESGGVLVPLAHDTMVDPATGRKEKRKVAKIEG